MEIGSFITNALFLYFEVKFIYFRFSFYKFFRAKVDFIDLFRGLDKNSCTHSQAVTALILLVEIAFVKLLHCILFFD
jgi:hypothetical protein